MFEARARLAKPDAIMHPDVQNYIDQYLSTDGNTRRMIALLADGYQGRLHQIDALGHILQKIGVDFRDEFESFLLRKVIHSFNPGMADSAFEANGPAEWIMDLAKSQFWSTVIVELSRKYPTCAFLCYTLDQVCQLNPRFVKFLPACRVTYPSFSRVLRDRLADAMRCSSNSDRGVHELIEILATDDRTIAEAALFLDQERDISLIHAIESFLESRPNLSVIFKRLLFKRSGFSHRVISELLAPPEFNSSMELVKRLVESGKWARMSLYVMDTIVKRLMSLAVSEEDEDKVVEIMQCLCDMTGADGDPRLLADAAVRWRKHDVDSFGSVSILAYASQRRFFGAFLAAELAIKVDSPAFFGLGQTRPSSDSVLLREIAYHHADLIPFVFQIVEKAIRTEKKIVGGELHLMMEELYDMGFYLFSLGQSIEFVRLLAVRTPDSHNHAKRKALIDVMRSVAPPFSRRFLTEMLKCLTAPHVKSIFFPASQKMQSSYLTSLEVLVMFCGQLNQNDDTRTSASEALAYEQLRNQAREILFQAKTKKQATIDSFF